MGDAPAGRLKSLDLFRGATIASMILVNNPGTWSEVYPPLRHAVWDGWTFTDTVFPFFLWIVGLAVTLSTAKRVAAGQDKLQLLAHGARRAGILFAIGLFLTLFPHFDFINIRIPGVLQRIAVCYLLALAIFLWSSWRGLILWTAGLNTVYLALMMQYPVPVCGAGSWTMECNFARFIDGQVLAGHMWASTKDWDPEGLISTIPAITTVLLGMLAGYLLRGGGTGIEKVRRFMLMGFALVMAAVALETVVPVNKALWTTTFVLLMAGLASVCFAVWYWVADIQGWARWFKPFEVYGLNAIAAYMLSGLLADIMGVTKWQPWVFQNLCLPWASPVNASLIYGLGNVAVVYAAVWVMYKRGWFLKL
jgi:predicted acyltransferase